MSSAGPQFVTAELALRLVVPDGSPVPVTAGIRYDATDPYAVTVTFFTGASEPVRWTFARQLLTDGVESSVGEGDVRVWPAQMDGHPIVYIALSSPSGRALFEASLADVVDFLSRSYLAVPTGSESDFVDVAAELSLLLSDDTNL
jgi:Streptomyces sporulation and cell division protein, SsgA